MKKGKAFIIVGHGLWGKSKTLMCLQKGSSVKSRRRGPAEIDGIEYFVRRMSNDEKFKNGGGAGPNYLRFVRRMTLQKHLFAIFALCPNFDSPRAKTIEILRGLKQKYDLYFWVMKYPYNWQKRRIDQHQEVTGCEIEKLEQFGTYGSKGIIIKVYRGKHVKDTKRAKAFEQFIVNNAGNKSR